MGFSYFLFKLTGCIRSKFKKFYHLNKLTLGKRVSMEKDVVIRTKSGGAIKIGDGCFVGRNSRLSAVGGELTIGNGSYFNKNADVVCRKKIQIGNNCALAPGVMMYDHDHVFGVEGIGKGFKESEIIIEDNCWIGANVIILRGTHIGKNSVIGAGCVIKGEIPEGTLVKQGRNLDFTKIK